MFETKLDKILERVEVIDPIEYGRTRNYKDGAVTRLSPYISRGVISTRFVLDSVLRRGFRSHKIEKFIQELAWRDYFQNVWRVKGDSINKDLKNPPADVQNNSLPEAVLEAETGIEAIDEAIRGLYETGYVHNHIRMYIASIVCNIGKSYWRIPARWFYYHLLDGDWASNTLSWQWVAGTFSNKKYYANQENINKFCHTRQSDTFLDVDYSDFPDLPIPGVLRMTETPSLQTILPEKKAIEVDNSLPTLVYNSYNLDPFWKKDLDANRILLLEPDHFEKYPVSSNTIDFILKLAENITGIQIYVGEFASLKDNCEPANIYFKEHPTAVHYEGNEEERDWLFPEIKGYFPSFFRYWRQGKKLLKRETLDFG
jgi:deoxyribodipyrimidine photo-lyase